LLHQIEKLVQETEVRRANADYLSENLKQIPGITPARLPANSRSAWHLYAVRYDASQFHGLPRAKFMQALAKEGVPTGGGYREQYFEGIFDEAINSRGFKRLWPAERLKAYRESFNELKGNKQACETTVAMSQSILLADRKSMDEIIEAFRKIQAHSEALAKA
jgi:dTDP-4-amino-4,6-dideoxygalactose transaminase